MQTSSLAAREAATDPAFQPYSPAAKTLHWIIVALLIVQYAIGFLMPEVHRNTKPEGLISLHLSFGAVILLVAVLRLAWRVLSGVPEDPTGLPAWQRVAGRYVHYLLYALIIAIPMLGWANASYRGWKISIFGLIPLPHLVPARDAVPPGAFSWAWTGDTHTIVGYVLLGVAGLHLLAALYHRFVLRNRLLDRMLPKAMAGL
jgi:cytochrome b561